MADASGGSLSCSRLSTFIINRSYRCRNSAGGCRLGTRYISRNALNKSSTWFFSESFANTPMARVSRSRCSRSWRLSAGSDCGAAAGAGEAAGLVIVEADGGGCTVGVAADGGFD